jgi:hypothetical protein
MNSEFLPEVRPSPEKLQVPQNFPNKKDKNKEFLPEVHPSPEKLQLPRP